MFSPSCWQEIIPTKTLQGRIREILAENEVAIAVFDSFPVAPGHALVLLRRHCATIWDLDAAEIDSERNFGFGLPTGFFRLLDTAAFMLPFLLGRGLCRRRGRILCRRRAGEHRAQGVQPLGIDRRNRRAGGFHLFIMRLGIAPVCAAAHGWGG
ncbi:MAG: HIT domain-containing protein [Betaproteobacteria bacterium]|nr:MAG: HIT domain-containing protein [Betaproteobacteria bacterium]